MKLKSEYKLRELGDTYILIIDRQGGRTDMTDILSFNESAAWLWKQAIGQEWDEKWLAERLCGEYEIDPEYAAEEASRVLGLWKEYGLIEE